MLELHRLDASHAMDVLAFELANRAYFAASISDRGDAYFDQFNELYGALLAEQEAGSCACYALLGENGCVLGRFNLYDLKDDSAEVGYRMAKRYAGRGLATTYIGELCRLAATQHSLHTLRAAVNDDNIASQRVLAKAGFVPVGPADPAHIGGRPGTWYQRDLITD